MLPQVVLAVEGSRIQAFIFALPVAVGLDVFITWILSIAIYTLFGIGKWVNEDGAEGSAYPFL